MLNGSTATTWIMECAPRSARRILIKPSLSGTRLMSTADASPRKSKLAKSFPPSGSTVAGTKKFAGAEAGRLADGSPIRPKPSPPAATCSPVSVERTAQGFSNNAGRSAMLPGNFGKPLRSST